MSKMNEYVVKHPIAEDPLGVDPNNPLCRPVKEIGYMYSESLYKLTARGIEPALATALPAFENGGTRWIVSLRQGVKFHNGTEFTAADVKYSLEFIKNKGLITGSMLINLEKVTVEDDYTVVIDLSQADSFLLSALSVCDGPRIVAEGAYDIAPVVEYWEGTQTALTYEVPGVTTGPYELIEYTPQKRVVLSRFDDYWGWDLYWGGFSDRIPKYVVFEIVNDPTKRVNQLIAQEQDWHFNVLPSYKDQLQEVTGLHTIAVADPVVNYLSFVGEGVLGWNERGLHNRKAISAAIDRIDLNNLVNGGLGSPAFSFWHADDRLVNHATKEIHTLRSDYHLARQHLKEAGNPDGFTAHLGFVEGRGYDKPFNIIKEQVSKVGIELISEPGVAEVMFPRVNDNQLDGLYHDAGDSGIWAVEYARYYPRPSGLPGWHMDDMPEEWLNRFMDAMDRFRASPPDTPEYQECAKEVQWINADLCVHVPVMHGARLETFWDYLSGVQPSPTITPMMHGVTVVETDHGPPERDFPI